MKEELEEKLFAIEPKWFNRTSMQSSLMCFGFDCGDGWYALLERLLLDAKAHEMPEDFQVVQVKSKFGGLRFYTDNAPEHFQARVSEAEAESFRTCEVCGEPGKTGARGWIQTLCDAHAEEGTSEVELMAIYRTKPALVQALQWDGSLSGGEEIRHALGTDVRVYESQGRVELTCGWAVDGRDRARPGDWIVRMVNKTFVVAPDEFEAGYELA